MAKASPLQTSFNGGIFSPLLDGHINAPRRASAVKDMLNMIGLKQGPATRRGGSPFIFEVKDSSNRTAIIPFEFNVEDAFIIEVGDIYFRFYKDHVIITEASFTITGITQANPGVVTTSAAHGYTNGDHVVLASVVGMVEVNGRRFTVANVTATTFELSGIDTTSFTAYISGGTSSKVFEIVHPYTQSDLFDGDNILDIKFTQFADVMYIVNDGFNLRSLARVTDTNWTLTDITFLDGPYLPIDTTTTTLTPSGTTGSVTMTASSTVGINDGAGFLVTDIGRLLRITTTGGWAWGEITGHTSTTVVTVLKKSTSLFTVAAQDDWRLGLYSDTTGFPNCISFFEDRLALGSNVAGQPRVDLSFVNGFSPIEVNFAPTDESGAVSDDNAISRPITSTNKLLWLEDNEKALVAGTAADERLILARVTGDKLTPANTTERPTTSRGSANIQPVKTDNAILFPQRFRRKLHEYAFVFESDSFRSPDLTILSENVTRTGVIEMAYQEEPLNVVWAIKTNGELVGLTYERSENIVGWHRHAFGGFSDIGQTLGPLVESIAVIPSPDTTKDELYVIVNRFIDGSVKRYIEYLTSFFEDTTDLKDAFHVDSGITFDNPIVITGATQADPVVVTTASPHGGVNGGFVDIEDVVGMTELNGSALDPVQTTRRFKIANVGASTMELQDFETSVDIDGTGFAAYVSGGEVRATVTSVAGLDHLEGEAVDLLVDGKSHPQLTVTAGKVTLLNSARGAVFQIGLKYRWILELLRQEAGARDGTAQGKLKRLTNVNVDLLNTLDLSYGTDLDNLDVEVFDNYILFDQINALKTGWLDPPLPWPSENELDGRIMFTADGVFPATIRAIAPQLKTEDR